MTYCLLLFVPVDDAVLAAFGKVGRRSGVEIGIVVIGHMLKSGDDICAVGPLELESCFVSGGTENR